MKISRGWRNFPPTKFFPDILSPDQNFSPIFLSPTKTFTRFFYPRPKLLPDFFLRPKFLPDFFPSPKSSDFSVAVVAQENTEDARSDNNENSGYVIVLD